MFVTRKEFVQYCVYQAEMRENVNKELDKIKEDIANIKYAIGLRIVKPEFNGYFNMSLNPYAESEDLCDVEEKLELIEKHLGIKYQKEAVKPATYIKTKGVKDVN